MNFCQRTIIRKLNKYFRKNSDKENILDSEGCCSAFVTLFLLKDGKWLEEKFTSLMKDCGYSVKGEEEDDDDEEEEDEDEDDEEEEDEDEEDNIKEDIVGNVREFVELTQILNKINKHCENCKQSDVDKAAEHIANKMKSSLAESFNNETFPKSRASVSFVFKKEELTALFKEIEEINENKLFYIGSLTHAVGLIYRNENKKYYFYEPNSDSLQDAVEGLDSHEKVVEKLFQVFKENTSFAGLSIDIFSKDSGDPDYSKINDKVKHFISSAIDKEKFERKDADGNTALHFACYNNHETLVIQCIDSGYNLTAKDEKGNTPLLTAAGKGHKEIVDRLIQKKLDLAYDLNKNNRNIFMKAAGSGNVKLFKNLVDNLPERYSKFINLKTNNNKYIISYLLPCDSNNYCEIFNLILSKSYNIKDNLDENNETILHIVAREGSSKMLKILLSNENIDAIFYKKNSYGQTALDLVEDEIKKDMLSKKAEGIRKRPKEKVQMPSNARGNLASSSFTKKDIVEKEGEGESKSKRSKQENAKPNNYFPQ